MKSSLYLAFVLLQLVAFRALFNIRFNALERIYCLGFVPLFAYTELLHPQIPAAVSRLPFLPLLMTSVYCGLGVTYFWVSLTVRFVAVRVAGTAATATSAGGVTKVTTSSTKKTTTTAKAVVVKGGGKEKKKKEAVDVAVKKAPAEGKKTEGVSKKKPKQKKA